MIHLCADEHWHHLEFHELPNECDQFQLWNLVVDLFLKGLKIAVDCANGAASESAPDLYARAGAEVIAIHNAPNGININDNCGSTHLESLIETVKKNNCDLGIAHDGDADRCLAIDAQRNVLRNQL